MAINADIEDVIFDREALDRHTMGNEELQKELFMLFFDQIPVYMDQLDEALSSGDSESWRMAAHGIKGSSRALGFTRLAALALDCEQSKPDVSHRAELQKAIDLAFTTVSVEKSA